MKDETKQKLNEAKEYVIKHKGDIIAFCATSVVAIAAGYVCGTVIGKYINMTNAEAFRNGWQKGMSDSYDLMMSDNVDKPEVVKALVDFHNNHRK